MLILTTSNQEASNKGRLLLIQHEALAFADIPKAFDAHTFETYMGDPSALEDCHHYSLHWEKAKSAGLGLFIRGEPESQKTFLAVYALKFLLAQGRRGRYASMPDLVDAILRNDPEFKAKFVEPEFLVLDNLNAERNTFWPTALLRVLTARRDHGLPTICVTQLTPNGRGLDPFEQAYGRDCFRLITRLSHTVLAAVDDAKQQAAAQRRREIFIDKV